MLLKYSSVLDLKRLDVGFFLLLWSPFSCSLLYFQATHVITQSIWQYQGQMVEHSKVTLNKVCMTISPEELFYEKVPFGLVSSISFSSGYAPLLDMNSRNNETSNHLTYNPFTSEGFPTDEYNCLVLDRVKSISGTCRSWKGEG